MLDKTSKKLESYRSNEPQRGVDGQLHTIDRVTRITTEQCESMAALHSRIRPTLSVETGLAYGFSTLPILDAMARHDYGHHVSIDPGQLDFWHGVAYTAIQELGFTDRFTLDSSRSEIALVGMIQAQKRVQFAFLDGNHLFEGILTDIVLLDQLMDVGGVIVVNDMWLPAVRSIASYVRNNMEHYEEIPSVHENIFVFTKKDPDSRSWNHFVPFDGRGETPAKRGIFRKFFANR